jgi:hypothetical protein
MIQGRYRFEHVFMNKIIAVFCALLVNFALMMVSIFFMPIFGKAFFVWIAAFFVLGLLLIIITVKQRVEGKLKFFLILTGASAAGFVATVVLHNFIYGLFIFLFGKEFWTNIGLMDEPLFFFIAILVCPIAFLVGAIGSMVTLIKGAKK